MQSVQSGICNFCHSHFHSPLQFEHVVDVCDDDGDVMNDQRSQLEPEVSLPTSQPQSNLRDPTLSSSSKFGVPDADRDEGVPACQDR